MGMHPEINKPLKSLNAVMSRFKVVPVEARFQRGRWQCLDFTDDTDLKDQQDGFIVRDGSNAGTNTTSDEKEKENSTESSTMTKTAESTENAPEVATSQTQTKIELSDSTTLPSVSASVTTTASQITTGDNSTATSARPMVSRQASVSVATGPMRPRSNTDLADLMVRSMSPDMDRSGGMDPIDPQSAASGVASGQSAAAVPEAAESVAAIDNKIEQAMDLVKTHLTFAVREEVEVFKNTILELKQKVAVLEQQNQVLRKFAPPEILQQLSALTAQQMGSSNLASPRPSTPNPPSQTPSN